MEHAFSNAKELRNQPNRADERALVVSFKPPKHHRWCEAGVVDVGTVSEVKNLVSLESGTAAEVATAVVVMVVIIYNTHTPNRSPPPPPTAVVTTEPPAAATPVYSTAATATTTTTSHPATTAASFA